MDDILNIDLAQWRLADIASINWSLFGWILGGAYLLVILAMVIRVILKIRSQRDHKPTVIDQSFSAYKTKRIKL